MKIDEIIFFQLIKEKVPEKVLFRSEGGPQGKCEIIGDLGEVLKFLREIHTDGFSRGFDTAFKYAEEKKNES